jgi:type IV pilus assembly protein PilM
MFGKRNHLFGLDIGSKTIKAAELVENKNLFTLKKIGITDILPGLIEEGMIRQPEAVAELIRKFLKSINIKEQNVAISVGGYSVIAKKISLQNMSEEQLQDRINYEAEQYIPYDVNDVNLDFQILGTNENNPNLMDVLLVAARKEFIKEYVDLVQMAGLNPCVIDVDGFALQNIFEMNYDTSEESIALIDIGACKTSLNIMNRNASAFMRDVSLGCSQIDHQIMSTINCTAEEADHIKFGAKTDRISSDQLRNIVSSVYASWCSEKKRALDFYYSTYQADQIKRIVLSGGGANIKDFHDLLSIETSTEVEMFNPFENFNIDDKFDSAYLQQIAPQLVICMGLATRRVDDK